MQLTGKALEYWQTTRTHAYYIRNFVINGDGKVLVQDFHAGGGQETTMQFIGL